jgi:hypothetical protein
VGLTVVRISRHRLTRWLALIFVIWGTAGAGYSVLRGLEHREILLSSAFDTSTEDSIMLRTSFLLLRYQVELGLVALVLGAVAIVGGVFSLQYRAWGSLLVEIYCWCVLGATVLSTLYWASTLLRMKELPAFLNADIKSRLLVDVLWLVLVSVLLLSLRRLRRLETVAIEA